MMFEIFFYKQANDVLRMLGLVENEIILSNSVSTKVLKTRETFSEKYSNISVSVFILILLF